ncbi:glycosyl hydrolase [Pollutibacter soli]|uniref:glycosyl hydrolase n=1 Tax=Pollutibacter soli TaxID=3034157 RepID=UPI0030137DFB
MKWSRYRIDLSLLVAAIAVVSVSHYKKPDAVKTPAEWFPYFDFNPAKFSEAPREYGPFTRWWLPGNDINDKEISREISLFAENGFAGVEVQPFTMGLKPNAPAEQLERIYSWDSPEYYKHLEALMQSAEQEKVTVDLNAGSGWPMGGSFIDINEGMKTLAISDTLLAEGAKFSGELPMPQNHDVTAKGMMAMLLPKKYNGIGDARLLNVIAARVKKKEKDQIVIEKSTITDITLKVRQKFLVWSAPEKGEWVIIASWTIPTGEKPSLVASKNPGYVTDAMDPAMVTKSYDHLFGARTGLTKYYEQPLRAVFNDSYEYHTDRLISPDFIDYFKSKNGYDISPYLSTIFTKGYNHPTYLAILYPDARPPFSIDEPEAWRMMYDYDRTLNEAFRKNFIQTSNNWFQRRGMMHRNQAYGFPTDLIGNAGVVDIPEAEQLFAEGSEGYLKLVSSGAHLNNRPVITQESFVSIHRSEMTTPQKIKIWADKSFAAGINQLIYHGTPYRYNNGEYGKEGWNPFSSPYQPYVNFSTGMNESDPFWKYIGQLNKYLTRCQYVLRAGKPKTDVLIYMPFIDFTENQIALNPEEILYRGYFTGVEPDLKGSGVFEPLKSPINAWYTKLWDIVNELEAKGITWEFVNDDALQKAKIENGLIRIEEKNYKTLVLANLPYIQLSTAKKIFSLAGSGMNTWFIGGLPQKQPSYLNYKENDKVTAELIQATTKMINSRIVSDPKMLPTVNRKIIFLKHAPFARMISREMSDSSQIRFIWNKSEQWQTIKLQLNKSFAGSYWLDPETGKIAEQQGTTLSYELPPYGSVIFYASTKKIQQNLLSPITEINRSPGTVLQTLKNWKIEAGTVTLGNSTTGDWRTIDSLKYNSEPALYTTTFNLDNIDQSKKYFLDLGEVYFTAEISVNNKKVETRLFAPYSTEITRALKKGQNKIEVTVATTRRNGFIGQAIKGNPHYVQYRWKENTLLPSGLVGPAVLIQR